MSAVPDLALTTGPRHLAQTRHRSNSKSNSTRSEASRSLRTPLPLLDFLLLGMNTARAIYLGVSRVPVTDGGGCGGTHPAGTFEARGDDDEAGAAASDSSCQMMWLLSGSLGVAILCETEE
jgi:hypothetical protein